MARTKTPRTPKETNKQVLTMPDVGSVPAVRKIAPPTSSSRDLAAQIRERAYELYLERGSAPGHENEDWLRAENEVLSRENHQQTA